MRAVVAACAVVAFAACSFDAGTSAGDRDASVTPDSGPGSGDGNPEAPDANNTPPAAACGGPGVYADDFDDNLLADFWLGNRFGPVVEAGGGLVVAINPLFFTRYEAETRRTFDMTGADAIVEVSQIWTAPTSIQAFFSLRVDAENAYTIVMAKGELSAVTLISGVATRSTPVAFDPDQHRFWRFAERDGTLSFDASADGTAFTPIHSVPTPPELRVVRAVLGASSPAADTDPPDANLVFDNFNTQVPGVSPCAAESLSDDFEDGAIALDWSSRAATLCTPAETGGQLALDYAAGNAPAECFYSSRAGWDLEDHELVFSVDQLDASDPDYYAMLVARNFDGSAFVLLGFSGGQWCARERDALNATIGVQICNSTPPAPPLSWRLRESGGSWFFEHSTDGTNFTVFHSGVTNIGVSNLQVFLGSGSLGNINAPSVYRIGAYNP